MKITLMNKDIRDALEPEEPPKRQIGFCVPAPEEVEEEDEEDYDD